MMECIEGELTSRDGTPLFTRTWRDPTGEAPRGLVVIVHGLGEHGARYASLADTLVASGFVVGACDHRGHGRSGGLRGHVESFGDYTADLGDWIHQLRCEYPMGLPCFLLGQSMGGLITLKFALDMPSAELAGVILTSPCLEVAVKAPAVKVFMARALARVLPRLRLDNELKTEDLSRDPAVIKAYEEDPLVHRKISSRWYMALGAAMASVGERAQNLEPPSLWVLGGEDRICSTPASQAIAASLPPDRTMVRLFEGAYHEPHNGPDGEAVFSEIVSWLFQRVSALSLSDKSSS